MVGQTLRAGIECVEWCRISLQSALDCDRSIKGFYYLSDYIAIIFPGAVFACI